MKYLSCSLAFCAVLGGTAQATTIRYDLVGSVVTTCTFVMPEEGGDCGAYLGHSFDGTIEIDESKLSSGTLRNQSLFWYVENNGEYIFTTIGEDFAALDLQLQFESLTYDPGYLFEEPWFLSLFFIQTDADRNPIQWGLEFLNDGPDYVFGYSLEFGGGLSVDLKEVRFEGHPGTLQLAPIPLPATGLLLLAALFGGVSLHRRRRPA
jgi:hypothetical protein